MPSPYDANASLVLTFRGRLELALGPTQTRATSDSKQTPEDALAEATHTLVRDLAARSAAIGRDIEAELQRLMPPGMSALAQVSISEGSLVIAGVITFIQWAATSEVVSGAFAELVKRVTGFAVDRVLERYVRSYGANVRARGPLRIEYQSIDQLPSGPTAGGREQRPEPPAAPPRPSWIQRSALWLLLGFDSIVLALILIAELLRAPRLI